MRRRIAGVRYDSEILNSSDGYNCSMDTGEYSSRGSIVTCDSLLSRKMPLPCARLLGFTIHTQFGFLHVSSNQPTHIQSNQIMCNSTKPCSTKSCSTKPCSIQPTHVQSNQNIFNSTNPSSGNNHVQSNQTKADVQQN